MEGEVMIIAFTGAGVSKQSGIQTFQEVPGIREKLTRDYATRYPEKYRENMTLMYEGMEGKYPNDAHLALAENNIQIITMNIDTLHEDAGSHNVLKLHGRMPRREELEYCNTLYDAPVLYGDLAPNYQKAYDVVKNLKAGDTLLVIGVSYSTMIATELVREAKRIGCKVIEVNEDAAGRIRKLIQKIKE